MQYDHYLSTFYWIISHCQPIERMISNAKRSDRNQQPKLHGGWMGCNFAVSVKRYILFWQLSTYSFDSYPILFWLDFDWEMYIATEKKHTQISCSHKSTEREIAAHLHFNLNFGTLISLENSICFSHFKISYHLIFGLLC